MCKMSKQNTEDRAHKESASVLCKIEKQIKQGLKVCDVSLTRRRVAPAERCGPQGMRPQKAVQSVNRSIAPMQKQGGRAGKVTTRRGGEEQ